MHEPDGRIAAARDVRNIVLRSGAELIARRFAGADGAGPIDRVRVGFGQDVVSVDTAALTPPADAAVPASALETALAPAAFTIATDKPGVVSVAVSAVFVPTVDLADVTEAALASADRLYNQVVFEPVQLRVGQNVTFFWQIDFPFG
ncbi:MAG: hypothetical protein QM736_22520 [Vicinamibacterales bacterium]